MSVRIQTSQNVDLEYETASIGDRILANLLDRLIYVGWVLVWILVYTTLKLEQTLSIFLIVLTVVLPVLFYPLLTEYFLNGQTLGKRAMNIRVVKLDGTKPTLGAYILRWLLILIDTEILTPFVAVVTIAANGRGQRIGDIAAGTTVIKTTKQIRLSDVTFDSLPQDYQVTYLQVKRLNDRDVDTIRQVLKKDDDGLLDKTTYKIASIFEINLPLDTRRFLNTVVNDYAHLASLEEL